MRQSLTLGSGFLVLLLAVPLAARPAAAACVTGTTAGDFAAGTVGACYLAETADGEVILAPTEAAEFSGVALPAGWGSFLWAAVEGGPGRTW